MRFSFHISLTSDFPHHNFDLERFDLLGFTGRTFAEKRSIRMSISLISKFLGNRVDGVVHKWCYLFSGEGVYDFWYTKILGNSWDIQIRGGGWNSCEIWCDWIYGRPLTLNTDNFVVRHINSIESLELRWAGIMTCWIELTDWKLL